MTDSIKKTLHGAKDGWDKISIKKKIAMISVIFGIILLVTILTYNNNKVDYAVLFSNLELSDAGTIVNDLETKGIKYKLENNGRNILIDDGLVDGYRLQLAMDGMMPESSTGFEIFDNTGMMVTDEDRQIMYQRALTGELQRSIMSLESISSAKVHLVMPEKSIFDTEEKAASASVIIEIKPSQKVTEDMIRGIAALISGAVDNMPIENIQVIDSKGNLHSGFLNEDSNINALDVMTQYQAVRSSFESEIESNLSKLLGSAFGQENIRVSVLADLDFDSEETSIIAYSNPVIRSQEINAAGGNMDVQQVNGGSIDDSISNVVQGADGDNSTYSSITNNELTTETKTIIKAPGKVNKLTTTVIYDGKLSDVNLVKIQNIAATATGYDSQRGDLISVEGIEFDTSYNDKLQEELDAINELENIDTSIFGASGIFGEYGVYVLYGLRGLGVIAILVFLILTIKNVRKKNKEDKLFQERLASGSNVDRTVAIIEETDLEIKPDAKGNKALKYAKDHPELAADLIKAWMKD